MPGKVQISIKVKRAREPQFGHYPGMICIMHVTCCMLNKRIMLQPLHHRHDIG